MWKLRLGKGKQSAKVPPSKEWRWDLNPYLTDPEREHLNAVGPYVPKIQTLTSFGASEGS